MTLSERVWDELVGRYGTDLRAVIRYHPVDYEYHMREDVRRQYTDSDVQSFVDEAIINQLGLESKVDAVDLGPFRGLVRIFDEAWVLIWPDSLDEKSGFLVTLERDGSPVGIDAIEAVDAYLADEIGPRMPSTQSV
ncbi:hypothetical protein [Halorientalis sp.]|uniref:hypothetical protein n=1 Tax=Halorientalis sp. TaxID=1931229 RepID=UPI0026287D17|nr:hypothetical protein [Halorientalis sp.]